MAGLRNYSGGVNSNDPLVNKTIIEVDPTTSLTTDQSPKINNAGLRSYGRPVTQTEQFTDYIPNEYEKYIGTVYGGVGQEYLNKQRAQEQTGGEQFVGFLNQAVIGEIVGGTIEGIGTLLDFETYGKLLNGTEKEFGNWFSDIGKSLRTWSEDATPIYRDPDAPKFDPGSWSWWMQNGKSVASTLSLMIPSGLAVRGLSSVAKFTGIGKNVLKSAELLRASGKIAEADKILQSFQTMKWAGTGVSQAAISRHMENMMEASGVQKEMYDKALAKGMSVTEAEEYAAKAASKTYSLDWAMFLQDLPQYMLLNSAFGKATVGLAEKSIGAAIKMGKPLTPIITSKAGAIGLDMIGEGFEEGYQFIAAEEAKYLAEKIRDPKSTSSFDSRLNKYLKDGEFWTNVSMGALGAGVMQTAGKAINDLIQGGDPQTRFVKEFGTMISHAAQQVQYADILGSESGKRAAITNLTTTLASKAVQSKGMDYAKDMIKRTANPSETDMEQLGIKAEDLETLQLNSEEILKHLDSYEKRYEDNAKKYEFEKALRVTNEEFLIDTFNGYKNDYSSRLDALKNNITNFNSLSFEAQDIFGISSQILANQKRIDFQKKRLDDTKNPLEKKQKEQVEKLIASTEKTNTRLRGDLKTLDESRDEETKKADDDLDIGGPYNLLNAASDSDITGHAILEYKKLDEALAFADETLKSSQARLKQLLTGKKEEPVPPVDREDLNRIPESDDYVLYEVDGKQQSGIVDRLDEDGDYIIIPTTKWSEESKYATNPSGTPVTVSKDKVVLDKKQYAEEDIQDESLNDTDTNIEVNTPDENASEKYLDVAYMHDGGGNIPVVDNEDLNRFLSNPNSSLDGVTAEMHIDTTSDFAIKYFKDKGLTDIEIRKMSAGKFTDNDINEFKSRLGGFDTIPISIILVKDGKILFKGGMYYHNTDFKAGKAPSYIVSQGLERTQRYLNDQKQKIRTSRFTIVPNLLKGNEVYSDVLRRGQGYYNNTETRGNVLERHGLAIGDAQLAVSRKNGKIYRDNYNIIPGVTSNTAGAIFAPTKKTINGKEAWGKVNPTKLTQEHAEILWDAIVTRYSKGKGRLAQFPDNRVQGLNVGEVITMLALFGERKTNIDHPDFKGNKREDLRNKTLFINSGRQLTFGTTTIDIWEDDIKIDIANREAFIKWATANKNYSIPIGIKPMGVELNSPLKRTFKLGSWENKADKDGNFLTMAQFLMSSPVDGKEQFAVVSDLQEYEGTGSVFTRPSLLLGDNANAIKVRVPVDKKVKVPKDTAKSKARTKAKKQSSIDSEMDFNNLPVGSMLYYSEFAIEDGVTTDKKRNVPLAYVEYDKRLGRVLNISPMHNANTDKWQWIELDQIRDNFKTDKGKDESKRLSALLRSLKSRGYIDKLLIDTSNAVEETVAIPPSLTTEKIQVADNTPSSSETVDDLENLLGIPMLAEFAEEVKSIVNLPKELKWFHEKFGKQNVQESDKLLTLAGSGRKAFSVFTSDCVYIFTGAPEGALYHEAFHRVFLGYLSEEDRQIIYTSYRKQFNYDMDDNMVSERLAEDFRSYRLSGTTPKSRTILQFFKDLYNFIYTFFTGETRLAPHEIDKLYDSINRGQYKYSKITAANRKKLEGMQVPMAVEIRKTPIALISNYHELDKIVKFLTSTLILTNEIDNLNDITNIKMSKMWDQINVMTDRLNNMIGNTQKQLDNNLIPKEDIENKHSKLQVSTNLFNILNLVKSDEYRNLFVDKISDQLTKLNVKRIKSEDEGLDVVSDNYTKQYDEASYEINSKDNMLASVKFLIATLRQSNTLDPHIGIPEFVDFNGMWNSLMHNLYDINDVNEMMDRLQSLTDKGDYKEAYSDLINKLNSDKTGYKKQQLRESVQKHRHNFINFLFRLSKEEVPTFEILNADVSSASKRTYSTWNLLFYASSAFAPTTAGIVVNNEVVNKIADKYKEFTNKVEKEYTSNNKLFKDKASVINAFVALLNSIGIEVNSLTVEKYIQDRPSENTDDALFQTICSDFTHTFETVRTVTSENSMRIFSDERYVKKLAEAYVQTHPEEISDTILGASGNQYFVYSQNSHVSDTIRKIRTNKDFLIDHLNKVYNDNSYYGEQLLSDDKVREALEIFTFSMFGKRGSAGSNYLDINPIEDYTFKLTAMANGIIPFPTMADSKTYYLLKGVKPFDFKYNVTAEGTFMPEEAITILLGYAKSERNRIVEAKRVIDQYEDAKKEGNAELIKELERGLVEDYHYTVKGKNIFTGGNNSSALQYHNFPSFNRKDFDFDKDASNEIRKSITENVREELYYAESLGIVSSYTDARTNKKSYYNRLLDAELVKKSTEDYGSADMAIKNIIVSYFVNTVIANNEIEKLFSGDPAYYKRDKDTKRVIENKIKRLTVLTSTGDNFANTVEESDLNDSTFNVVTLGTQKYTSIHYKALHSWHMDYEKSRLKEAFPNISADEIDSKATVIVSDKLKAYRELDPTDGQAWISPEMYKSLSKRLGEWSDEKDVAFNLLQLDRELTKEEEFKALQVTFQPLKLVYFDLVHDGNLAIPTYYKASFATIFRTMSKGKYGDMQITDMLDRMEGRGKYNSDRLAKVDMFVMDSATKSGNRSKGYALDDTLEKFNDLSNLEIYKHSFFGLRRQLVTDAHDIDRTKTGTQFLKIVMGNLELDKDVYEIDGKPVNGTYVRDIIFDSLKTLSDRGRQELEKQFGYNNGRINKKKLVELLVEDAKKSNASDNLIDAITMTIDQAGNDEMYLELDALTEHKWIQSRIISLITKKTIDVRLPGNQLIQFSNFGMRSVNDKYTFETEVAEADKHVAWIKNATDDLKWMTTKDGKVIPMGCIVSINLFKHIIPNYENISYKEKVAYLKDNPDLLGYRIPTQGQNSVFMLTVTGIYPETVGDTITLPSEFTALTGSDFDIDKIYVVRYNYINVKNKLTKVAFIDGDTNDESVLKEIYDNRYGLLNWRLADLEKIDTSNITDRELEMLSEMVSLTDDAAVEDAILKIRTNNRFTLEDLNKLREKVKDIPTEEQFIKDNKGKSIYELNSRWAIENRLIDAFFSVMRSEAHYDQTSAPLGGLTDKLKKKAQKIRAVTDTEKLDMYYQSPRFNEQVKFIYTGGKNGIGPFALNNVHHIMAQLAGLEMKGTFGDVMLVSSNGNIDLAQKRGKDGILISNWLSALIDSHVDVAKDPYIMDLNINSITYNVASLLIRGGTGEQTFDFLTQPILRELATESLLSDTKNNDLTKKLRIEGNLDEEGQPEIKYTDDAVEYVSKKWSKLITTEDLDEINKLSTASAFNSNLNSDLFTTDATSKEFIKRQILVLKAFTELRKMGDKLNTLIQASQIDTKKFGSNITELRVFLNKIRKVYDENAFINLEKILPYNPDTGEVLKEEGSNFLGAYAANSIQFSLNVLGDVSIYTTPVFQEIFNKIVKVSGNEFTTDSKFVNMLSDEIFTAMISKFFSGSEYVGLTSKNLQALLTAVARELIKIKSNKDGVYNDLKDNSFLKYLNLIPTSDELFQSILPMFVSVPMRSTKDKADKDNMINSFNELLKHDRPEIRGLARQLFLYAYFTSGYRSRIYSFFNMLPNEMFRDLEIKDPTNPKLYIHRSYNTLIKKILEETKNPMNVLSYNSIVDDVIINNHDNDNLIKYFNDRGIESSITEYKGKKYDRPIGIILKEQSSKRFLLGFNDNGQAIYRPYIKTRDEQLGHIIYKYIGIIENKPVYVTQNMMSYNARGIVLKEYGMGKSIIDEYNKLMVITPAMEEEFMIHVANGTEYNYVPKNEQLVLFKEVQEDEKQEENKEGQGLQVVEEEFPFIEDSRDKFSTNSPRMREVVKEMGIIDWSVLTKDQWKILRDEYAHCK